MNTHSALPLRRCGLVILAILLAVSFANAQSLSSRRIASPIQDGSRITLKGNVHPMAQPRYDLGPVPDSFPTQRMLLLLQRSPQQETALRQFLQDAHRPGNPRYHKWITPRQFGAIYGPADEDIAVVTAWLQGHGLSVARLTKGKTAIEFSGTAAQVREAFRTEIHIYSVNGAQHYANNVDPQVPSALAPVIAGITPMNDFAPQPYIANVGEAVYDPQTHRFVPNWTFPPTGAFRLDLGPADFAIQYDLNPLYTAGVTGQGVTIGIIGASNVDPSVVATYRSFFGLPPSTLNVVIDGSDPGQNSAVVESYLDVEQAGAVAPGATVNLYTAADTDVQYGLNLAALRAVDDDVATVLSTSYGGCEQNFGSAGNQFWAAVWEQAAAQGQTSLVSSGDGGPAGCDNFNGVGAAQYGIAVNAIASTPWNIAVGGTDFYYSTYNGSASAQQTQMQSYWDTVATLYPTTSLLQPVPEQPWNRSFGLNLYDGGVYDPNNPRIVAGSGGPSSCATGVEATNGSYSSCTAGYAKPSWQAGTGVPADGVRDLPDVSLFAASGENGTLYPICFAPGECIISDGDLTIGVVGGTSASSPSMAGIMALINQKYGPQGQANFTLYPLAVQHPTVFHDITTGSNIVPCNAGTPNCALSNASDNTKGYYIFGFPAAPGYDMATGLGTVDANLLVQNWNSLTFKSTSTTLSLDQTTFTHGSPVKISVGVSGSGGTPTGDVALVTAATPQSSTGVGELTLKAGTASSTLNNLPGGQYKLTARYAGDNLFASSSSTPVTVNVSPEASAVKLSAKYYDWNTQSWLSIASGASYPYGTYFLADAQPQGANSTPNSPDGIATGTITFSDAASAGNLNSGALALDRTGTAEWYNLNGFPVGTHSLSAAYSGDASFSASATTTPITFSTTKIAPSISICAGSTLNCSPQVTVALGTATTLTAIVGVTAPAAPPSGTVTFYLGSKAVGTVTLGPPPYYNPSVSAATLTLSNLPLGTNTLTVSYPGDSNYTGGPSYNSTTVYVLQPTIITASASPASLSPTQSFTVTASVSQNGKTLQSGVVGFYANGPGGSWDASANIVNGSASFTFPGPYWNPGTVNVDVSYSGDSTYASADLIVPVTITNPFTMTATPVTTAAGSTTGNSSTITITPGGGFTGSVYFSCTIAYYPPGAQHLPTCTVPTSISVTGTSAVTAAMTITSTPPTTTASLTPNNGSRWLFAQLGGSLLAFLLIGRRGRRGAIRFLLLAVLMACIVALPGCGGGSNGGGGGGKTIPGTTPGTYKFMVEGSFTQQIGTSLPQVAIVNVTIQ